MTKPKHLKLAAAVCLVLAVLVAYLLLVEIGLADDPNAISITPYIWLEYKYMKWSGTWFNYYVEGWWFEDGEYYHLGDWRKFMVTFEVYQTILEPWVDGNIARLCKLGIKQYDNFASSYFCWPSFQNFQPVIIR